MFYYLNLVPTLYGKKEKRHKNNECKLQVLPWDEEFKLLSESYFVSDIQVYFESIIKKYKTLTNN